MPQVWKWTPVKREVLQEVFLGEESFAKIIQKHALSRATFNSWMQHPEFRAELQKLRDQMEQELFARGIQYVTKEHRITALARMAESAREEYEAHKLLREIRPLPPRPGAKIVMNLGEGAASQDALDDLPCIVNESFNRDAHAAFRESLGDIAKELGHRTQKVEHSGNADAPLVVWTVPQKPR